MNSFSHLPGADLIATGLSDCAHGRVTPEACLIAIGWPRLLRAGLDVADGAFHAIPDPEHTLYGLLGTGPGDAYGRYNSLIRRLISFEQALEQQAASNKLKC